MTDLARQLSTVLNLEGRPWYRIDRTNRVNASTGSTVAKVYLYDAIGGYFGTPASDLVQEIAALDVDEIELHINSPGGSVYDGIAIRNALIQHRAKVTSVVDGLAASAASYVALAGDEVVMAPNSELMIHDAMGICMGWAQDMTKMAEDLNRISDNIASMYAAKAGGSPKSWRDLMLAETWYSADEAVKAGLADRVDRRDDEQAPQDVENRFDLSVFNFAGRSHAPDPAMPVAALADTGTHPTRLPSASAGGANPPAAVASGDTTQEGTAVAEISDEQLTTLRQRLGVADDADVDTCLNALTEALEERAEAPAATTDLPEGVVPIAADVLAQLQSDAAAGRQALTNQETEHRSQVVGNAIREGRITAASRETWEDMHREAPQRTEALLAQMPANTAVPVEELGHAGFVDSTSQHEGEALMAELFPKEA